MRDQLIFSTWHSLSILDFINIAKTVHIGYPVIGYPVIGYPMIGYPVIGYLVIGYPVIGYPVIGYPVIGYPAIGWIRPSSSPAVNLSFIQSLPVYIYATFISWMDSVAVDHTER